MDSFRKTLGLFWLFRPWASLFEAAHALWRVSKWTVLSFSAVLLSTWFWTQAFRLEMGSCSKHLHLKRGSLALKPHLRQRLLLTPKISVSTWSKKRLKSSLTCSWAQWQLFRLICLGVGPLELKLGKLESWSWPQLQLELELKVGGGQLQLPPFQRKFGRFWKFGFWRVGQKCPKNASVPTLKTKIWILSDFDAEQCALSSKKQSFQCRSDQLFWRFSRRLKLENAF